MQKRIFPHLAILFALAVAQPLYELIGQQPGFLAAHGFGVPGLLLLVLGLSVGLPLLAWLSWRAAAGVSPGLGRAMLSLWLVLLFALILLPVLGDSDRVWLELPAAPAVALALVAGLALCALYFRSTVFRLFLTVFSLAAVVFPLKFLFFSPASQLMMPGPSGIGGDRVTLQRKPPVIFLLFDEFPLLSLLDGEGRIDRGRFPNLAALQEDALWFPYHSVNSNSTLISVSSLLSGNLPYGRHHGLPLLENYPDNAFVLLGAHYDMNVWEHGSQLCPEQFCGEYASPSASRVVRDLWIILQHIWAPPDWDRALPPVDNDWMDFGVQAVDRPGLVEQIAELKGQLGWNRRLETLNEFVESIDRRADRFHYFHAMLPHGAWQHLPDGRLFTFEPMSQPVGIRPGESKQGEKHVWYDHPDPPRLSRQAHLLQVGFVDRLVGRVVTRLREQGLYDQSVLVLTSDHGAAFIPGESRRSLKPPLLPEVAGVPLLIKFPDGEHAGIDERPSQAIDIVPTLLGFLGAQGWSDFEGVNLLTDPPIDERPLVLWGESAQSVEVSPQEYRQRLRRAEAFYTTRDGHGDYASLFRSGDEDALVGRAVPLIDATQTNPAMKPARMNWKAADLVRNNRPDAGVLQLVVDGTLSGGDFGGRKMAFSVNGTVRAVSHVLDIPGDENRVRMLLPPDAFTDSDDFLQAWFVEPGDGRAELVPVIAEQERRFELLERDGQTLLRSTDREYAVEGGVVPGWGAAREGRSAGLWIIGGWAASLAERQPAESLILFVDGGFVMSRPPQKVTDTVAKRYDMPEIRRSAFDLPLVAPPGKPLDQVEVRLFALSRSGKVSEIHYPRDPARWPFRPNPKQPGPAIKPYD